MLTIVVPFRNRAERLRVTLHSLECLAQTTVELLLVDNGSDATTHEMVAAWVTDWQSRGLGARLLEERKQGAPAARNRGLTACKTPWVYFFDSDDELDADFPTFILDALQRMEEGIDLCFVPVRQEQEGVSRVRAFVEDDRPYAQILSGMMITSSMVFRTTFLRCIGGWDTDVEVWQDWELGVRALMYRPRVAWLTQRAYNVVHVHDDSVSGRDLSASWRRSLHTMDVAWREVMAQESDVVDDDMRARCSKALTYRAAIMHGKLSALGEKEGARAYSSWVKTRGLGLSLSSLLYAYTRLGGHGAWRLALRRLM